MRQKFLTRVSHRGVPVNSLMLSGDYLAGGADQLSVAAKRLAC